LHRYSVLKNARRFWFALYVNSLKNITFVSTQLQRNISLSHSRMKIHVWRYNGACNNLYQQKKQPVC